MAKRLISREEIVGNYPEDDITPLMAGNISKLLDSLNKFRLEYGKPMIISSGLRTEEHNKKVGGSPKSAHLTGEACDFRDKDRSITTWILANPGVLERCNLYMEHPSDTPTWVHLGIRRPASGNRIFKP